MESDSDHTVSADASQTADRLAILEIEGAYAQLCDSGEGDAWADLFTPDGVYQRIELPGMPDTTAPVRGRAALAQVVNNFGHPYIHRLHTPQITLLGDRATVRTHFEFETSRIDEFGNFHETSMTGFYHTDLEKGEEGWKIRNRVTVPFSISTKSTSGYKAHEIPGPGN